MANITNKRNIFFVTSPRTPFKMRDEIKLLIDNFQGKKWDKETQTAFAEKLSESDFFEGKIEKNLDFAATDRITILLLFRLFVNQFQRLITTCNNSSYSAIKQNLVNELLLCWGY